MEVLFLKNSRLLIILRKGKMLVVSSCLLFIVVGSDSAYSFIYQTQLSSVL